MPKLSQLNADNLSLTPLDESLLTAMYLLSTIATDCEEGRGVAWLKGRAIACFAGGRWDGHRHAAMIRMQELGLVACYRGKQSWLYALTDVGGANRASRYLSALKNHGVSVEIVSGSENAYN